MAKNTAKKQAEQVSTETEVVEAGQATTVAPIPLDDKGRKKEVRMSMEELERMGFKNKSQIIRYLVIDTNHAPAAVAKFLGVIYQHVRNVVNQPLKRPAAQAQQAAAEAPGKQEEGGSSE